MNNQINKMEKQIKITIGEGFIQFFVDELKTYEKPFTAALLMQNDYSFTLNVNGDKIDIDGSLIYRPPLTKSQWKRR